MSCSTLNQNSISLNVAIGALPEGFCPASMQELAQAIADRLIVTPGQTFNGFAIGSVEPPSNVGPWFKDCEQFFVFDDETARYVPISRFSVGLFTNIHTATASETFVVPPNIYKLKVEAWGGGGGGTDGTPQGGGGGGGGFGLKLIDVIPGQNIDITMGLGGANNAAGTNTVIASNSVTLMTCSGGAVGNNVTGAVGGSVTGADIGVSGGCGFSTNYGAGGEGGSSPNGGSGGVVGTNATVQAGIFPGGGGVGGTTGILGAVAGAGANGKVIIWY